MKYIALFFSLLFITANAQNNFERGKIETEDGTIINSYVGVYNWQAFPEELDYKIDLNSTKQSIKSDQIKAVYLDNGIKYFKRTIEVDNSSNIIEKLDNKGQIDSELKTIFLKLLVDGSAKLYIYLGGEKVIFYYETQEQQLEQLEHKKYLVGTSKIGYNTQYLRQLQKYVSCNKNKNPKVRYTIGELTNFFLENNDCFEGESSSHTKRKFTVTLKALVGVNSSSINAENSILLGPNNLEFQKKISPSFGLTIEGYVPGNSRNYFSPFISVSNRSYKTSEEFRTVNFDVNYSGIEFMPGARYYFNLKEDNYLFGDFGLAINIKLSESVESGIFDSYEDVSFFKTSKPSFALGAGYKLSRFSLLVRYYLPIHFKGEYSIPDDNTPIGLISFNTVMKSIAFQLSFDLF